METRMLIGAIGVTAAFGGACVALLLAAQALRSRRVAMAAQGDESALSGLVSWRLRNGFAVLDRPVGVLLGFARVRAVARELAFACNAHGFQATPESIASVLAGAVLAVSMLAGVLTDSPVAFMAVACCACAFAAMLAANMREKRHEAVREAVPEALESMSACMTSGFTLLQTFRHVADDTAGPLGDTFARSAHVLEMGGGAPEALAVLREGAHASELAFVAVALDVQHQSGGAMGQVLEAATDTVKGELALRRSLRVQTAQAKLSARVVVVMPFILIAAFSLASPGFLDPFFSSAYGYALLALALVMQAAGIVLVRRALSVEGVS